MRVYLATQPCDMRKGMDGLAAPVQNVLARRRAPIDSREMIMSRGAILKNVPKLVALSQSPDRSFADHNHPSPHFEGQVRKSRLASASVRQQAAINQRVIVRGRSGPFLFACSQFGETWVMEIRSGELR
ncbi:IS66 family insertion sequence element accessory protein TnpB [Mesorhizobium delmotii]|uniref:IS66 family insertion sequence element accessory protein TnpB n=1 Tax=Mesorhizobium delmotii TaxID=1631247 RepID=UPI0014036237